MTAFEHAAVAGFIALVILFVTWLAGGHFLPSRWHAAIILAAIAGLLALFGWLFSDAWCRLTQDRGAAR